MAEISTDERLHEHVVAEQLLETMLERVRAGEIDDLCYVYENCDELKRLVDVTGREMIGAAERMREEREKEWRQREGGEDPRELWGTRR